MQAIKYKKQDDLGTLSKLVGNYASLSSVEKAVEIAYTKYKISKGSPYNKSIGLTKIQKKAFHDAYRGKQKKLGLRWIVDLLDHDLGCCPMCGSTDAGTVEHYLPKTPFPEFSVFSRNLFPSCSTCNSKRGAVNDNDVDYPLLHPFFDGGIYRRLQLMVVVDFKIKVAKYTLSFNRDDFDVDENKRIDHHLSKCLDQRAFKRGVSAESKKIRVRSKRYKTLNRLRKRVEFDLLDLVETDLENSWTAALYRGVLAMTDRQLELFLRAGKI